MTPQNLGLADAQFSVTKALPNGAAAVNSDSIDLAHSTNGLHLADCELKINAPALATAALPDTKTMTYKVEDSADDSSFATIADAVIVQTGAGGAGAAAAEKRFRFPSTVRRYVRVTATNSGAGDASGSSLTANLMF